MKQLPQVAFIHAEDVVKGHEVIFGHLEGRKEPEEKRKTTKSQFGIFVEMVNSAVGLQISLLKIASSNCFQKAMYRLCACSQQITINIYISGK